MAKTGSKPKKSMHLTGFMAERVKKQSILNANLFKKSNVNYSDKVQYMVNRLNSVLNKEFISANR